MKKYYAVAYLNNGDMCVSPCDTEEECLRALKKVVVNHYGEIKATTYMVREDGGEFLFGHPFSRDLVKNQRLFNSIKEEEK